MSGPLNGVAVVEIASIGPGPFSAMVLADLGAQVFRIERVDDVGGPIPQDPLLRGRAASIALDIKRPEGLEALLRLVERSDVLIEGFRPGVMERLGLGPEVCAARNPRIIYSRMTGWGQRGPRSATAGHDIDYIALAGALHPIGAPDAPPLPPLNLVADFGGGAMLLLVGVLSALLERDRTGLGQVVDAAMVDGVALLTTIFHGMLSTGLWSDHRGSNLLDGTAPFYRTYRSADGGFIAVGALEPKFYTALIDGLGLAGEDLPDQYDRSGWPCLRKRFKEVIATRSRDEWVAVFNGTDACVAPVLSLAEAPRDSHLQARGTFVEVGDSVQPAPAPRFSRSVPDLPRSARVSGADPRRVLADLGYDKIAVAEMLKKGIAR